MAYQEVGFRGILGMLMPATTTVQTPSFYKMLYGVQGVSFEMARILPPGYPDWATRESMVKMAESEDLLRGVDHLMSIPVKVIGYGCTSATYVLGRKGAEELVKRIEDRSGIPATTMGTAVVKAAIHLGISKVSVLTAYTDDLNQVLVDFFREFNIEVLRIEGLGLLSDQAIERETSPDLAYRKVKELDRHDAQGIVISCGQFRCLDSIAPLERDLGKPVITSNQASLWHMLQLAQIKEPILGFGKLLE